MITSVQLVFLFLLLFKPLPHIIILFLALKPSDHMTFYFRDCNLNWQQSTRDCLSPAYRERVMSLVRSHCRVAISSSYLQSRWNVVGYVKNEVRNRFNTPNQPHYIHVQCCLQVKFMFFFLRLIVCWTDVQVLCRHRQPTDCECALHEVVGLLHQ